MRTCSPAIRRACYAIVSLAAASLLVSAAMPQLTDVNDVKLYGSIASRVDAVREGVRSDVESEYPPLATALFWTASRLPLPFSDAWSVLILIATASCIAYLAAVGKEADAPVLVASMGLGSYLLSNDLAFGRLDVFVALPLVLSIVAFRQRRYGEAAVFVTVAAMIKAVPIFLLPLLFLAVPNNRLLRVAIGTFLSAAAGIAAPLVILGPKAFFGNVTFFLRYHGGRGVQHESVLSNADAAWRWFHATKPDIKFLHSTLENSSVAPVFEMISKVLALALLAGVLLLAWRTIRSRQRLQFDTAAIALLLGMLSLTPVLSPQYFMWVIPLLVYWCADRADDPAIRKKVMAVMATTLLLGWLTYLVYKAGIEKGTASVIALHSARSFVLVGLSAVFLSLLARNGKIRASKKPSRRRVAFVLIAVFLFLFGFGASRPRVTGVTYSRSADGERIDGRLPLFLDSDGPDIRATITMRFSFVHPVMFRVKPDDCIRSLEINGVRVDPGIATYCDYGSGRDLDLSPYLRWGENTFDIHVFDEGGGKGGIDIAPSAIDPLVFGVKASFAVLLAWLAYLAVLSRPLRSRPELSIPIAFGVVERVLYAIVFDQHVRGHDTAGHEEYVRYVADTLRMPHAQTGWEFHQAPLYYFVTGSWMRFSEFLGFSDSVAMAQVRSFSFLCSIASVALCAWIMSMLLSKKKERTVAVAAGMLAVSLPSFVFVASRIGNDALYQPLALALFAFLLRWWKHGHTKDWYIACCFFAAAFLAKVSALAFAPAMFLLFFARPRGFRWRAMLRTATWSCLLVAAIAGWYPVARLLEPETSKTFSLGNDGMNGDLALDNSIANFATFNPVMVLRVPYNDPWKDEARRAYYWEYFYRSAFFGEFGFDQRLRGLSVAMLFLGFGALLLAIFGAARDARTSFGAFLPAGLFAIAMFASSLLYRVNFGYSANQDFRFVVILIVPMAYFAARGALHAGRHEKAATAWLLSFGCLCAFFSLLLYVFA